MPESLNVIEFNDQGKGLAAGDFGAVLVSEDFGEQWFRLESPEAIDSVVSVSFIDSKQAIVATSTAIYSVTFY